MEELQHCPPQTIQRSLNELPESLDETYERVLKGIKTVNRGLACRLLQCLTVAIRPLRVEELGEILALDFNGAKGSTPKSNEGRRSEDWQQDVLSMCSSLVMFVNNRDSGVIQFSHISVKEFLTSNRLLSSQDISDFHIIPESAHTTLAQACLATLLQLDGSSNLKGYASQHWVEHAQFESVSSRIKVGMRRLFDSAEPYFSAWLQLHDIDDRWTEFKNFAAPDRGSPLYYASLCGFLNLAEHIIVEHPEQVNARGGHRHIPLTAALYNRHFDMVELLLQYGAAVDAHNQTPLKVASADGCGDVVRWLLDHGADPNSRQDDHQSPICLAIVNGHEEVVRTLIGRDARIDAVDGAADNLLHLVGFYTSLKEYKKKTNKDLLAHPLTAQLQTCNSPAAILAVLRTQGLQFKDFMSGDDKLTKWLDPTVNVLYVSSSGVGLVNCIRTLLP